MAVTVPPPPRPPNVQSDPALNAYLNQIDRWLQDLWQRTGGDEDIVSSGVQENTSPTFTNVAVTTNITVGGTVDGRDVATDGGALDTAVSKLAGIESNADVTDAANVAAAGAVTTGGDGIAVSVNTAAVDLATNSGLEFSTGQLRIEQVATDASTVAVGSVSVRVGGTTRKLLFA